MVVRNYPPCPPLAGGEGGSIAPTKSLYVSLYKRETSKKAALSFYEREMLKAPI